MASRVIEAGTIVARTQQLLRCGVLTQRPLWLDVLEALPPHLPTKHNRTAEPGRAPTIAFPEDKLRRYFFGKCECVATEDKVISLDESVGQESSLCESFVKGVQRRLDKGDELQTASQKTVWALKASGVDIRLKSASAHEEVADTTRDDKAAADHDSAGMKRLTSLLHALKHNKKANP